MSGKYKQYCFIKIQVARGQNACQCHCKTLCHTITWQVGALSLPLGLLKGTKLKYPLYCDIRRLYILKSGAFVHPAHFNPVTGFWFREEESGLSLFEVRSTYTGSHSAVLQLKGLWTCQESKRFTEPSRIWSTSRVSNVNMFIPSHLDTASILVM